MKEEREAKNSWTPMNGASTSQDTMLSLRFVEIGMIAD
jgi:hypothetical protein